MTLQGLKDTGIVQSKTEGDSFGRLTGTLTNLITDWKCDLEKDFSAFARAQRGRGGREAFIVIGDPTSETIIRGYVLIVSSVSYEIVEAVNERDQYGNSHHWVLHVEKMV